MDVDAPGAGTTYQIGAVADRLGLSLRTIRHYEEVGVVVPSGRTAGGYRQYTEADVDRLRMVMRMKPLDLTLEEIRDVLALLDRHAAGASTSEDLARLEMYAALTAERQERLRTRLALAEELTGILDGIVRADGGEGPRVPEAPPPA